MKKQSGVSLSEVLVSLFLASLIITMLMQFYLSSKRHYLDAEEILAAGFDLQWVSDLLSDSIRRAGFTPCLGIEQLQLKENGELVRGLSIEKQLIQVNRMSEHFVTLVNLKNATQILVSYSASFHEHRSLLIADCNHAEVHQIASISKESAGYLITLEHPLQFIYAPETYVGEFLRERWFIKKNVNGNLALYYQATQTEEVTSLIHSLQVINQVVHGKPFLEINMGLAENKVHKIMVAVRGS